MKKIYFIIFIILAVASLNASAQNVNGGIRVSKVTMTQTGNSVLLEMVLDIKKDAVTKCQSIAIAPTLTNGPEHVKFRYVLVNGENKRQIFDRKKKFRNIGLVQNAPLEVVNIDKKNGGKVINYTAEVAYEPWMENASLDIELVLSSCANELQLYSLEISAVSMVVIPQEVVTAPTSRPEPVVVVETPKTVTATEGSARQLFGSAYLDFEPESSVIVPFYKRNPQELAKINDVFDKVNSDPGAVVTRITIVGYASPEGRYSTNETLAYDRARSFARYIHNKYNVPVMYSNVSGVAEDWETLRALVVVSDIPDKSRVLSIIDDVSLAPDAKESKLRRMNNGRIWRMMTDEMFPHLRRVEYKIDYTVK